jgi:ribosomal protein S18 acetylase RimI-like enzyme
MLASVADAKLRDAHALMQLQQASFASDYASRRMLSRYLTKAGGINLISRRGDAAVGCAVSSFQARAGTLRLYVLAVHPAYRGSGLGTQILGTLLARAAERGVRTVSLEVRAENRPAQILYESFGFVHDRVLERYYTDGVDAFRLKLRLVHADQERYLRAA